MTPARPRRSPAPRRCPSAGSGWCSTDCPAAPGSPWSSARPTTCSGCRRRAWAASPSRCRCGAAFASPYAMREVPCEVDAELVSGPGAGAEGRYQARTLGAGAPLQRRGAVRVPVDLIGARARLDDDADAGCIGAVTENLSAGGALLRLARGRSRSARACRSPSTAAATRATSTVGGGRGALRPHRRRRAALAGRRRVRRPRPGRGGPPGAVRLRAPARAAPA